MQLRNGSLLFSASDLNHFIECEHLAWLERERAHDRLQRPEVADPTAELVARKGHEHEAAYVQSLRDAGRRVVTVPPARADLEAGARTTLAAMQAGVEVVYQAVLLADGWLGIADFLLRVERPSALGGWSYEVADAKLARRAKPYFLLQLCGYSEAVARLQERDPERMHVVLGTREQQSFHYREYDAYFRDVRRRFLAAMGSAAEPTYPLPVEHCLVCPWRPRCEARREADDHLCRVAGLRRDQAARLERAGIRTLAELGAAAPETRVPRLAPATFEALRSQAALQLAQIRGGGPRYELLPPAVERGFALLPEPSPGDVCFDMEGDPFLEGGLEYLFGVVADDGGAEPAYRAWWAHDAVAEKRVFEQVVDFLTERYAADPGAHVYHYAHYEPVALKRLAGRYGTREAELDHLLRNRVFVDLYQVVRQSLRVSRPDYSIKSLEVFYMKAREAAVKDAGGSILAYERWLAGRDPAQLADIARYNEEDCVSTQKLRDWLLELRAEAAARFAPPEPPPPPEPREPNPERERVEAETRALIDGLTAGLPEDPAERTPEQGAHQRLAHLLEYHQREERPAWWHFFERLGMTPVDLIEDPESIGGLEPDRRHPPQPDKKSLVYSFTFPVQEFKLGPGDDVFDPATGQGAGTVVAVSATAGTLRLKRGPKLADTPLPEALIPGGPYNTKEQRAALRRLAAAVLAHGAAGEGPLRATRELLLPTLPRVRGVAPGAPLQGEDVDVATALAVAAGLDGSHLFIQGPPGSGKTHTGAHLIVELLRGGARVGVTALSHRAIHNLLDKVEEVARARGVEFKGLKKSSGPEETAFVSKQEPGFIANIPENPDTWPPDCGLLAGTAWLFSREALTAGADYLFVDEAGQIALADALAVGGCARNLVFLGDPQQLPQVVQGVHPEGTGVSVLEHLLGDDGTIPPARGLFLAETWRMHPDVCGFVSQVMYGSRLHSEASRARQRVDAPGLTGTGLRFLPVEHAGNSQRSAEEAEAVREVMEQLLRGAFTDHEGVARPLTLADVLVVAPYNAQVRQLADTLPEGARVGTVDKFQGQQAAVVVFSMATSSGDELPRGLEFLFSRNRLNVAVSRAKALAVLVASPRLLTVRCHTADQMRMVNALCRFVEIAGEQTAGRGSEAGAGT